MKVIIIALILNLAIAEPVKRRYLKGAEKNCYSGEYKVTEGNNVYCVKCSDNCANQCVENKGCQQCKEGFFSDGNGGCDPCMLGCKVCTNKETCQTCYGNAYYMEGNCYLNPEKCKTSENGRGCVECQDGFFLTNTTNGNCTTCSVDGQGCAAGQCNSRTTAGCQRVTDTGRDKGQGYYISGGIAWKCDPNCKLCYEKTRDQSIYSGESITPGTPNGCLQCNDGYYWFESAAGDMKECRKCSIQCKTCSDIEYNCKSCNEGYELFFAYKNSNGTNVNSCRPKDTNCDKRLANNHGCEKCKDGYVVDDSKYCVPIHELYDETTKCGNDFAYNGKTCVPKSEHCETYDANNVCTKCKGLTYLKDGKCHKCHEKCVDCDNVSGICKHCQPDYYSNGTAICYPDVTSTQEGANEKLWDIGTNDQPIRCVKGKYVDFKNMTRSCKSCSQYCLVESIPQTKGNETTEIQIDYCDAAVGCLRCKEGFYVTPNGECSSCSPHCALCDQTLGCLHCLGETVKKDGRCEYSAASSVLTLLILLILAFAI